MSGFLLVLLLALNFAISWWNSYVVGKTWDETKGTGWMHVVTWSGAVMAAVGFSSVYMAGLGFGLYAVHYLNEQALQLVMSFWYVMVIIPLLGSGLIITLESWRHFRREGGFFNGAVAGYNTYAQVSNMVDAARALPGVFDVIGKAYKAVLEGDGEAQNKAAGAVFLTCLLIAVVALLAGTLHAASLIQKYRREALVTARQAVAA
jgi:hypothetical protein